MKFCSVALLLLLLHCQSIYGDLDSALKAYLASTNARTLPGQNTEAIKNLYNLYKQEFKRSGKSLADDQQRLAAFTDTLNAITDQYRKGQQTFNLGFNQFSDQTYEELSKYQGAQAPKAPVNLTNNQSNERLSTWDGRSVLAKAVTPLPSSYDLTAFVVTGTRVPVIQPVKNQGSCGSCYAFAFVTLLEFQFAVQLKSARNLSEQQIVDCNTLDKGCNGGYFTNTFRYLQNNQLQIDGGSVYPYQARVGRCAFKGINGGGGGVKFGSLTYRQMTANSASAMQRALVDYGPLWVPLFVGASTTTTYSNILRQVYAYKSGIMQFSGCPTSLSLANHAVVIVGYGVDTATNTPFWKVRNSWGTGWGEAGYFRIRRGVNMCGIESAPFYIARTA